MPQCVTERHELDENVALQRVGHVVTRILFDDAPLEGKSLLHVGPPHDVTTDVFARLGLNVRCVSDAARLPVMPYHAGTFDFVYSDRVLERVAAAGPVLREMARVLRVGGRVVVITGADQSAHGDGHIRTFTRRALRDALVIHGFESVACYRFSAGRSALAASLSRWMSALPDWLNDVVPASHLGGTNDACLIASGRKPAATRVELAAPPMSPWLAGATRLASLGFRKSPAEACG